MMIADDAGAQLIGYTETPVQVGTEHWAPGPDQCASCGTTLIPGPDGNVAYCDVHDQTCDRCDRSLIHMYGRTP
jgi:hypothetical protein